MKIKYKKCDLIELFNKKNISMLHGVNCRGVMGKGFAKQVKDLSPFVYESYKRYCNSLPNNELLGTIHSYEIDDNKFIINGFIQEKYGTTKAQIDYKALDSVIVSLNLFCEECGITKIYMPKIGAGLAGGDWEKIEKIITLKSEFKPIVCYL